MRSLPPRIANSLTIANSTVFLVFLIFLADILPMYSFLKAMGVLFFILCILVKILLYSGVWGTLLEIVSAEIMVPSFQAVRKNVAQYGLLYFLLTLVAFAGYSVFTWSLKQASVNGAVPMTHFMTVLTPVLMYVFLQVVIAQKYLKPLGLTRRRIRVDPADGLFLLAVSAAIFFLICATCLFYSLPEIYFDLAIFAQRYLETLLFIYLAGILLAHYPEIQSKHNPLQEIYMINPLGGGILDGIASMFMRWYPPVFVVLKALSPKYYSFRTLNRNVWHKRYLKPNKLVAITCYTSNCAEAYKIAKEFRKCGSKVVMGGPHVTYQPEEALEFCDSVVVGEAESVWKDVVRDYENGSLQPVYNGVPLDDFYSEVHQELLNSPPEIIKDFLETTRGCKFTCSFCTIPGISGGKARKKPVAQLVELINKIKHRYKTVVFLDNNIYSDPQYARELFKALKPLKIKWTSQCTIDIAKNDETLQLAKESGCVGLLFGYEISGGSSEKQQRGKFALADHYIHFTKKVKDLGISIKAHFIFGFDSDRLEHIPMLWKFCHALKPTFTIFSLLTPLPGSQVYREMLEQNRLTNLNWRNYSCHQPVFKHKTINHFLLLTLFPIMRYFFLLTTSQLGYAIMSLLVLYFICSVFGQSIYAILSPRIF